MVIIKDLFQEIDEMDVRNNQLKTDSLFNFLNPATISDDQKQLIVEASKKFDIELSKSFFELGSLQENPSSIIIGNGYGVMVIDSAEKVRALNDNAFIFPVSLLGF